MRDDRDRVPQMNGQDYLAFLARLHETLQPRTYLEIGTQYGHTLDLAKCAAIAVDPDFQLKANPMGRKPSCMLFQEESDTFFAHRDPSALFGGPIDLAFLDGMHRFEYLLRDFMNTEKHCGPDSLVVLHDCVPRNAKMAARERFLPGFIRGRFAHWWTGDVWRLVPALQRYRPDLTLRIVNSPPTGLVLITRLDPGNRVLEGVYETLVNAPQADGELEAYWAALSLLPTASLQTREQLMGR